MLPELLEGRRLLAANPLLTATLGSDGVLEIVGTKKPDVISITLNAASPVQVVVALQGQDAKSFLAADVSAIRANLGGGNDSLIASTDLNIPLVVSGDKGNDTITGGAADDDLDGGKGNDTLDGAGGDDILHGDAGNDAMTGGAFNDQMFGGAGNDTQSGSSGDDILWGEAGKDTLRGDDGNDNLDGGASNDDCEGGAGDDFVSGQVGRDRLRGGAGDDDLDGGSGNDDVGGDDGNDRLRGGVGKDSCDGGAGDDDISGDDGRDRVRGGDGRDRFDDSGDHDLFDDRGQDDNAEPQFDHVAPSALPAAVIQAFNTLFPNSTIREAEREVEDAGTVYKIDFIDPSQIRRRASFTEAGELAQNTHSSSGGDDDSSGGDDNGQDAQNDGQHIALSQTPQAVRNAFNSLFPNAVVREVERETEDAGLVYNIDFTDASQVRRRAEFTPAGQLIRQQVK